MASVCGLAYPGPVEPPNPAHGAGRLAPQPGPAGGVDCGQSLHDEAAKGQEAIGAWIEAANDLGGPGHTTEAPVRRPVLDAAK